MHSAIDATGRRDQFMRKERQSLRCDSLRVAAAKLCLLMSEPISEPDSVTAGPTLTVPTAGVLLGIDYGTKRVGVAVSDRGQRFSSPLHNHDRHGLHVDERFFRKVVEEYAPVGLVVGLPIHLSGDESEKSKEARKFAAWLTTITGLPHTFQDERFSSFHAEKLLMAAEMSAKKRKDRMDKLAAQILLQAFLDARIKAVEAEAQQRSEASHEDEQDGTPVTP